MFLGRTGRRLSQLFLRGAQGHIPRGELVDYHDRFGSRTGMRCTGVPRDSTREDDPAISQKWQQSEGEVRPSRLVTLPAARLLSLLAEPDLPAGINSQWWESGPRRVGCMSAGFSSKESWPGPQQPGPATSAPRTRTCGIAPRIAPPSSFWRLIGCVAFLGTGRQGSGNCALR